MFRGRTKELPHYFVWPFLRLPLVGGVGNFRVDH